MANLGKETADSMKAGTSVATDTIQNVNSSLLRAIDQNRQIVQRMMRAVQEESLHFVNQRLERTGRAIERSRDCQGLSELMTLQHEWFMDAARDYAEMTSRFGEVLREISEKGSDQFEERLNVDRAKDGLKDGQKDPRRETMSGDRKPGATGEGRAAA